MISSWPSPSRSASTGEAVAPMIGSRVKGEAGRGSAGGATPVSSALGQPARAVAVRVPDVDAARSSRSRRPTGCPSWSRSPTATLRDDRLVAGVDARVRRGDLGRVGVHRPARQLVAAVGSIAWTRPSASPKTIASVPACPAGRRAPAGSRRPGPIRLREARCAGSGRGGPRSRAAPRRRGRSRR